MRLDGQTTRVVHPQLVVGSAVDVAADVAVAVAQRERDWDKGSEEMEMLPQ